MSAMNAIFILALAAAVAALEIVPNAYIVEFDIPSGLSPRFSPHSDFYANLAGAGIKHSVRTEYNVPELFVGAAVDIHDGTHGAVLSSLDGVKSVSPVHQISPPSPVEVITWSDDDPPAYLPDTMSTHIMTGVDKLHAEGITGRGIKVGIIDSGIDYTNPWLGGCFGPGCKVASGWNFVGANYNATYTTEITSDVQDCVGHGTHVAGIVGANPGNMYNISGVAYDATLASYRVLGCEGIIPSDRLIDAMMKAYNDSCNVITISIGEPEGWSSAPIAVVASRITALGKIVTVAAGNDGRYGAWYASDLPSGIGTISVGSVLNDVIPAQNFTLSDGYGPVSYYQAVPFAIDHPIPIYPTSLNTSATDDACSPLPDSTPDLSGYVTLINANGCSLADKLNNAQAKGAEWILVYDVIQGPRRGGIYHNFTAALIPMADGIHIVTAIANGSNISATFLQDQPVLLPNPQRAGLISDFSTIGPTYDLFLAPSLAAPGEHILSTYPVSNGTFAIMSGTSMAAPFMGGAAALLLQAHGRNTHTAASAKDLFESTAKLVPVQNNDTSVLDPAIRQGAGLVNVYDAIHSSTILTPGELLLNDTDAFDGHHIISVFNMGNMTKSYTVSHQPAGTTLTYNASVALTFPLLLVQAAVTLSMSQTSFSLPPGTGTNISLTFTAPTGLDPATYPVYSGYIVVNSSSGESLHSSYLGVVGSVSEARILDNTDAYLGPGKFLPSLFEPQYEATPINYTDPSIEYFNMTTGDQPLLAYRLLFGTPLVNIDLISADENIEKRQIGGCSALPILGNLLHHTYRPRSSSSKMRTEDGFNRLLWNGTYTNGSYAANGEYKMLLRALKARGDATNEEDYEVWLSPIFGVNMSANES
ncbi:subtilisin-like protease [Calocera viscosa TUFC12733]|uniref:Subtilisin-like protease n=1 Tax=Calocera viscosa (strain TUFC12733) TaxID=1330018 RepID=A0A167PHE1_CALVF|nr:subtilisin-like protease [Calocera viscosa TUFC12733]